MPFLERHEDKASGGEVGAAPDINDLPEVPLQVITTVLELLPPNEVALSARRTCRAAAQHFAEEHHRTVSAFTGAIPPHATAEMEAAFRGRSFRHRLLALSAAAASGSVANLELVWRRLQPCLFPELLRGDMYLERMRRGMHPGDDPGTAAVKGGGATAVLPWLLDRCPGLVNRSDTVTAAARHCALAQLKKVWGQLRFPDFSMRFVRGVLEAATSWGAADAQTKLWWLLELGCRAPTAAEYLAVFSDDLPRLRRIQQRGFEQFGNWQLLAAALRHADLSLAQWLMDAAGCLIPPAAAHELAAAAAASGSVAKLRWLQSRGVSLSPPAPHQAVPIKAAAAHGQLEALRFLHLEGGSGLPQDSRTSILSAAVTAGHIGVAEYLLHAGCTLGSFVWRRWCLRGCRGGLAMVQWLLEEARVPAADGVLAMMIENWPHTNAASQWQLLQAVRLVAPPGSSVGALGGAAAAAARAGHLELLRYLHKELGCGLGAGVLVAAAKGGSEAVLEWLVEQGCAAGEADELDRCYLAAGAGGDRATLECLRRLGVPQSERILRKAVGRLCVPQVVREWLCGMEQSGAAASSSSS